MESVEYDGLNQYKMDNKLYRRINRYKRDIKTTIIADTLVDYLINGINLHYRERNDEPEKVTEDFCRKSDEKVILSHLIEEFLDPPVKDSSDSPIGVLANDIARAMIIDRYHEIIEKKNTLIKNRRSRSSTSHSPIKRSKIE